MNCIKCGKTFFVGTGLIRCVCSDCAEIQEAAANNAPSSPCANGHDFVKDELNMEIGDDRATVPYLHCRKCGEIRKVEI